MHFFITFFFMLLCGDISSLILRYKEYIPPFDRFHYRMKFKYVEDKPTSLKIEKQTNGWKEPYVGIITGNHVCSGIVISDELALSPGHCFEEITSFLIAESDQKRRRDWLGAKVIKINTEYDIALIKGDFRSYRKPNMVLNKHLVENTVSACSSSRRFKVKCIGVRTKKRVL